MALAKDFLVRVDSPAVHLFRVKFAEYVNSLDKQEVSKLIQTHPGEGWRIMLLERSGLQLPEEIKHKMEEYKGRQKEYQNKLDRVKLFIQSEEYKEVGHVYSKYKMWHYKCYPEENVIPLYELKMLLEECTTINSSDTSEGSRSIRKKSTTPLEQMLSMMVAVE